MALPDFDAKTVAKFTRFVSPFLDAPQTPMIALTSQATIQWLPVGT
jgi:hypothetical protein